MLFISPSKLFSFSRYLSFCHDFLVIQKKGEHFFLKNHTESVLEKLLPDPYLKNQN